MDKLLKNLHWFIVAYAAYDFYSLYDGAGVTLTGIESQIESQRIELSKNKKSEQDIKNYYSNIETEKARIETVAKEIEKMQQLLPSDISDLENIALLKSLAEDANIKEVSVVPDIDVIREFVIARKYRVKLKATYLQILIMFEKIGESSRILNVGEAKFGKTPELQRGKFQVIQGEFVLEAYRYNPGFKEDRGIESIEKKFSEPGGSTPPAEEQAGT